MKADDYLKSPGHSVESMRSRVSVLESRLAEVTNERDEHFRRWAAENKLRMRQATKLEAERAKVERLREALTRWHGAPGYDGCKCDTCAVLRDTESGGKANG